jgi:hypothetical protein
MPVQFPWETPPVQGPPSPSQMLLKRISGLGKNASVEPPTTGTYYNKANFANRFRSSLAEKGPGLSNSIQYNSGKTSSPKTLKTINNYRPLWVNGKVIKGSTSTSLATRGAVGLAITKYGSGGGGGEFSK